MSNEKDIPKEVVFEALETALVSATRKRYGEDLEFKVTVDPHTGGYDTFKLWYVMNEDEAEGQGIRLGSVISLEEAKERDPEAEFGSVIEEAIESVAFGRIAAQTAKQVIAQRLRAAKRSQIASDYLNKIGEIVNGTIKKYNREFAVVELANNAEGVLKRVDMCPGETYRVNDRVRSILLEVDPEARGPQMVLSRTSTEMLEALFAIEVPEISEGLIEIKGAARDPGLRAKVAVLAKDVRIDPIGACVGMRGSRVQAISNELSGERVDIVLWDENPAQYVINALAPAEIESLVLDDANNAMDVIVSDENLSQVIGRNGQNVRLASQVTGWELNVITNSQADEKSASEQDKIIAKFVKDLEITEELAGILAANDFTNLEEVAYVEEEELLSIEGLDSENVAMLREKANDVLLSQAVAEQQKEDAITQDMLSLDGMDEKLLDKLLGSGISNREELAELSTDDLLEIEGIDEELAGKIIMSARAIWFEDGKE